MEGDKAMMRYTVLPEECEEGGYTWLQVPESSSKSALASIKSGVSNPSVNHP
jgi:hypothetical protein